MEDDASNASPGKRWRNAACVWRRYSRRTILVQRENNQQMGNNIKKKRTTRSQARRQETKNTVTVRLKQSGKESARR